MTAGSRGIGRPVAGIGGVLLIVSLFLPWADAGGTSETGFQLLATADVYLLIVGGVAIAAALTWGRYALFRPDLSLNGATDVLALAATAVLAWLIFFDFPSGAERELGAYVALVSAMAIAAGVGDYGPFRGAPWFPRIDGGRR
jgi:hypothetical protein